MISVRAGKRVIENVECDVLVFEDEMVKLLTLMGGSRDPPSEFRGMTMIPYGSTLQK
jgi:hypothetical protein